MRKHQLKALVEYVGWKVERKGSGTLLPGFQVFSDISVIV